MSEKGQPLPKFGDWDVNDPASAEGFTMIFNKARDEKKTGSKPDSPGKEDSTYKNGADLGKPQTGQEACVQLTDRMPSSTCPLWTFLGSEKIQHWIQLDGEELRR